MLKEGIDKKEIGREEFLKYGSGKKNMEMAYPYPVETISAL